MTTIHHGEHLADRAAMLEMRAMIALGGERTLGPEARAGFDETTSRTPHAGGVTYEAATIGGVPGWWCRPTNGNSDGVILHHHGGDYVLGSAAAYRHYVGQIAVRAGMSAFTADCALAPERPYPAAMDDALAAYRGLVALGHQQIALAGDSAGGGLALSLLRSVCRYADLPRPLGAVVMSPWTDLALIGASVGNRAPADPLLTRKALVDAAILYLGDRSRCTPQASPLNDDLAGLPPVLIHVAEDEILLDDSLRYADRLNAARGRATVHVWTGMPHVFSANLGTVKAAGEALDIAGVFLTNLARTALEACSGS